LGTAYSGIVQAFIDVRNLSQLLSENPDIIDSPGATPIPLIKLVHTSKNSTDNEETKEMKKLENDVISPIFEGDDLESGTISIAKSIENDNLNPSVEFRSVYFNYPTQSPSKGLKDVSFTVNAGTTTAIVGPTGSGITIMLVHVMQS
jgi:ABC-type multidrug transport system fused ATPase/permease subunit